MSILVTNDDGVNASGLWRLVDELRKVRSVTVVAPSREQSAIGTAVSLRNPVRVQKVAPQIPTIETYAVDGTPSDSVILALGKLVPDKVELVVSGINQGTNLGEDVLISGTVGAALQAYLRGFPAMAVSAPFKNGQYVGAAAKVAAILARHILGNSVLSGVFLNVNMPELEINDIRGAQVTRLASESHINTVEAGENGQKDYYRLVRHNMANGTDGSDVYALQHGYISITPLYTRKFNESWLPVLNRLCEELMQELRRDSAR